MKTKLLLVFVLTYCFMKVSMAQGCSDAGFCTLSGFHGNAELEKQFKNELTVSYTYSTHLKNERFYQPQLNYKFIRSNGNSFELRLPYNMAKDKSTGNSNGGIGDLTATYNGRFTINNTAVNYSGGLRISFSDAAKAKNAVVSLPMFLQNGLGTTDLLAIVNYNVSKYFAIGTGIQAPLLQYNKNKIVLYEIPGTIIIGEEFRRKPDALLKLTGNYNISKLKLMGSLLGIFHLGNDYYNTTTQGKFILNGSSGITLNYSLEAAYPLSKRCRLSMLYAEPFKTRSNIPDGLARSRIFNPKVSFSF